MPLLLIQAGFFLSSGRRSAAEQRLALGIQAGFSHLCQGAPGQLWANARAGRQAGWQAGRVAGNRWWQQLVAALLLPGLEGDEGLLVRTPLAPPALRTAPPGKPRARARRGFAGGAGRGTCSLVELHPRL